MQRPYLQAIPALRANVKQLLILMVRAYQAALGPLLGGACKFHPSCSQYAVEALERHGAGRGAQLAARRLWRCRPLVAGGYDPVPEESESAEQPRSLRAAPHQGRAR